ncbi:MAG: DNA polymerase Y family protein [Clostridium sp.]
MKRERIIFHIDVNSAYLSWTAVSMLQQGFKKDIREIPSVVGGDPVTRHGIVLAKSIPAKKFKIETGETLYSAIGKCKDLEIYPPNYELFMECSNAMVEIFKEYTPCIQRYSVDECFLDVSHFGEKALYYANEIRERIEEELGFTVNIGISTNKLLAKMASDFLKPNKIHTLYENEIKKKMWSLPVEDLFMVGRATAPKLHKLNIFTIGDLAKYDLNILKNKFKSFGVVLHNYANGIDDSEVREKNQIEVKGIGNSTTTAYDVDNVDEAYKILLSLTENAASRLRNIGCICGLVAVTIKTNDFYKYSHQRKLETSTDCTNALYEGIKMAFNECYKGQEIRHLGVRLTNLSSNEFYQGSLFEKKDIEKLRALDGAIDKIRGKYGKNAVIRSTFLHSGIKPLTGGIGEDEYPIMSSIL